MTDIAFWMLWFAWLLMVFLWLYEYLENRRLRKRLKKCLMDLMERIKHD